MIASLIQDLFHVVESFVDYKVQVFVVLLKRLPAKIAVVVLSEYLRELNELLSVSLLVSGQVDRRHQILSLVLVVTNVWLCGLPSTLLVHGEGVLVFNAY